MEENRASTIGEKVLRLLEAMDDSESEGDRELFVADACLALAVCWATLFAVLSTPHRKRIRESANLILWLEQSSERSPDHA